MASRAADLMIAEELTGIEPKSDEYLNGMRNRIIFALSQIAIDSPFQIGTCQADAYEAGVLHAKTLIENIQV